FALSRPAEETATFAASFGLCRLVLGVLVQAGVLGWFALTQPAEMFTLGAVLSVSVWTSLLQGFSLDWFQGRLRVARVVGPVLATNVLGGLAAAFAVTRLTGIERQAACLPALELVVGGVLFAALARGEREWSLGRPRRAVARALLLGSIPVATSALLIMLYSRLDVFVLASHLPAVEVGRYGIA